MNGHRGRPSQTTPPEGKAIRISGVLGLQRGASNPMPERNHPPMPASRRSRKAMKLAGGRAAYSRRAARRLRARKQRQAQPDYSKPLDPQVEARILARLDEKLGKPRQEGQHDDGRRPDGPSPWRGHVPSPTEHLVLSIYYVAEDTDHRGANARQQHACADRRRQHSGEQTGSVRGAVLAPRLSPCRGRPPDEVVRRRAGWLQNGCTA